VLHPDNDVTVVGESLGGGLVIRVAAFEPRIRRAVSMDILDDEFEVTARQIGRGVTPVPRALLTLRAKGIVNAIARKPVAAWDCRRACTSPAKAIAPAGGQPRPGTVCRYPHVHSGGTGEQPLSGRQYRPGRSGDTGLVGTLNHQSDGRKG
jgi:pimeloyl-ACP methyl ester carboxylesterase